MGNDVERVKNNIKGRGKTVSCSMADKVTFQVLRRAKDALWCILIHSRDLFYSLIEFDGVFSLFWTRHNSISHGKQHLAQYDRTPTITNNLMNAHTTPRGA